MVARLAEEIVSRTAHCRSNRIRRTAGKAAIVDGVIVVGEIGTDPEGEEEHFHDKLIHGCIFAIVF